MFKRLLAEVASPKFQTNEAAVLTNADVLARGILEDAMAGDKAAREIVLDRVEGKAVRGQTIQSADTTVEDQITEAEVALLNNLAKPDKGADNV